MEKAGPLEDGTCGKLEMEVIMLWRLLVAIPATNAHECITDINKWRFLSSARMNKVRLSVTVDPEVIAWLDAKVKNEELRSRSDAAERALKTAMRLEQKERREPR